jgi:hypothetical protein
MTGPCKRNFEMERRRAEQQARRRFEQGGGLLAPISGTHRPGGLEKQARHPHGHSHTKHEDGDGGHRGTAVQALGSEMLSNTPIVTSYCVTQSFWGNDCARKRFSRACREGIPAPNWSKLLAHRSFAVGILCDAGSLMQNQRLAAKNPMSEPTTALKAGRVRLGRHVAKFQPGQVSERA